jgi:hypothetical protein
MRVIVRWKISGVNFRLCDGSGVAVRKDRLVRLGEWQRHFGRTNQPPSDETLLAE